MWRRGGGTGAALSSAPSTITQPTCVTSRAFAFGAPRVPRLRPRRAFVFPRVRPGDGGALPPQRRRSLSTVLGKPFTERTRRKLLTWGVARRAAGWEAVNSARSAVAFWRVTYSVSPGVLVQAGLARRSGRLLRSGSHGVPAPRRVAARPGSRRFPWPCVPGCRCPTAARDRFVRTKRLCTHEANRALPSVSGMQTGRAPALRVRPAPLFARPCRCLERQLVLVDDRTRRRTVPGRLALAVRSCRRRRTARSSR